MAPFLLFSIAQKLLLPSFAGEFPVFEACRKNVCTKPAQIAASLARYFPRISNSILTFVPGLIRQKLVFSCV